MPLTSIVDDMLSNFRLQAISLAEALRTRWSCRRWMSDASSSCHHFISLIGRWF